MKEEKQLQAYNIKVTALTTTTTTLTGEKQENIHTHREGEIKVSKQLNKQVNVPEVTHAKYS